MKFISKLLLTAFIFVMGVLLNAQPPCPTCPPGGGGGVGGTNPEAASAPIDMYVYVLGILAILIISYYSKKIQKKAIS